MKILQKIDNHFFISRLYSIHVQDINQFINQNFEAKRNFANKTVSKTIKKFSLI